MKLVVYAIKFSFLLSIFISFLLFPFFFVSAQPTFDPPDGADETHDPDEPRMNDPLEGLGDPNLLIGQMIKTLLGVLGSVALILFTLAGFTWLTSQGNPEAVLKAKRTLFWTSLGLIVVFASYALVKTIINSLIH
jgi:hypothetical protein